MREIYIAITAASYSGNKGAAAMLQSSISQLHDIYGDYLNIRLMSVYPSEDREQIPYDFIEVVSCKPEKLLFIAFPLAILHWLFQWCPPIARLIERNKILKAYKNTDLVIDEAGISFVDSRGFVMNTYAFVCAAVPILMKVPVVKYSQAMGPFEKFTNRTLAKIILPKLKLICARGDVTYENLMGIGLKNVILCADGAFTMPDDPKTAEKVEKACEEDRHFYNGNVVGISLSSVVEKKCASQNIDYPSVMAEFIDDLNRKGFHVLLIANAARIHSEKPRNNDLMVCDRVYDLVQDKSAVRWEHREMTAEEIREWVSRCRVLVGSRFHAMIGALEKKVPVLLIGWSHKYKEVLDMFGIGQYAIDYSGLNLEELKKAFYEFLSQEETIRRQISEHYEDVMASSRKNIESIRDYIDREILPHTKKGGLLDYSHPERYLGEHLCCRKAYASSEEIRENAASGGMVTALLCHLLQSGDIDGAWVTRTKIEDGNLSYKTYIATSEEEIRKASSSIYMELPLLKHLDMVRNFSGKLAVVLTPCMMHGFSAALEKDDALREKVVLKIGLYCSGNHSEEATLLPIQKLNIPLENAERLYYRRGHWRGMSSVIYKDGSSREFSYSKTICAYKNAYFFEKKRCMLCQDHFAQDADISVGDIWLKKMKNADHKYTCCVIRSDRARQFYQGAVDAGALVDSHVSRRDVIAGQKRALVFKFNCAKAKKKRYPAAQLDTADRCSWNHRLAFWLAEKDRIFSEKHYDLLKKIPMTVIYYYMCFIRVLLSF